jgi:hypothetical protein
MRTSEVVSIFARRRLLPQNGLLFAVDFIPVEP